MFFSPQGRCKAVAPAKAASDVAPAKADNGVTPAKAGVQFDFLNGVPAFAGTTIFGSLMRVWFSALSCVSSSGAVLRA